MKHFPSLSTLILSFVIRAVLSVAHPTSNCRLVKGECYFRERPTGCRQTDYVVVNTSDPNKWCCQKFVCDETTIEVTTTSGYYDEGLERHCEFSSSEETENVAMTATQRHESVTAAATSRASDVGGRLMKKLQESSPKFTEQINETEALESSKSSSTHFATSARQTEASSSISRNASSAAAAAVTTSSSSNETIAASTSQAETTTHLPTAQAKSTPTAANELSSTIKQSSTAESKEDFYDFYEDRPPFSLIKRPRGRGQVLPRNPESKSIPIKMVDKSTTEASTPAITSSKSSSHSESSTHESDLNAGELRHNKSEVNSSQFIHPLDGEANHHSKAGEASHDSTPVETLSSSSKAHDDYWDAVGARRGENEWEEYEFSEEYEVSDDPSQSSSIPFTSSSMHFPGSMKSSLQMNK